MRYFKKMPTIKVESSWKYDTQEAHLAEIRLTATKFM